MPTDSPERFEKLYTMLLDSIPSSVLLVDPQHRVVSANRNFLAKSRLAAGQVVGEPLEKVFPPLIVRQMNLRAKLAEAFRTGEPVKGERMTYRAPGLATRTYYYSLLPFRWAGVVENVLLLMEDVTEKVRLGEEARRAERHLASVVESANDLLVSTDLQGRVLTWNAAAVRVAGREEREVAGRMLCDLCHEHERPALARFLARAARDEPAPPLEAAVLRPDGSAVPISWVCSPMRGDGGEVTGLVAVGRDLSERRRLEAQLLQSEKLAALGVMAGGIAHEVRNPLAVVSSAAQLLMEGTLPAEVQSECAERIHRGVQRASGVIESLLRFARPSDKGVKSEIDLVPVLREAADLVRNQLRLARVEFADHYPDRAVHFRGNAGLLQQLVTNLLLNAVNAMPEGGGAVALRLEAAGGGATLTVTDTGRGIPQADLPRVFDPFFTTMPVGKGTGLGLSICYAICQHHDAAIDLASQEGVGTVVTIRFPADGG